MTLPTKLLTPMHIQVITRHRSPTPTTPTHPRHMSIQQPTQLPPHPNQLPRQLHHLQLQLTTLTPRQPQLISKNSRLRLHLSTHPRHILRTNTAHQTQRTPQTIRNILSSQTRQRQPRHHPTPIRRTQLRHPPTRPRQHRRHQLRIRRPTLTPIHHTHTLTTTKPHCINKIS